MRGKRTLYHIIYIGSCVAAVIAALAAWRVVPYTGNPWNGIIWFSIAATLSNLLSVDTPGCSLNVTPSSPIYWASTCVLGPLPSIIVCVISGALSDIIAWAAYKAGHSRRLTPGNEYRPIGLDRPAGGGRALFLQFLTSAGIAWEPRANQSLRTAVITTFQFICSLVLSVGPAGIAYYYLGGKFLISPEQHVEIITQLVLPFIGLVAVSLITEHTTMTCMMAAYDFRPGVESFYDFVQKAKLVHIETTLPVYRAQMALAVVALMISYLYASIGVWGIILAAMPVVALRDFFYQWVEEQNAYFDTITALATYMQHYHPYTRGHLKRVADISVRLARELRLPTENIRHISTAGFLHDIGKVGVSEEILDKPGALNNEEWERIKEHPVKGAEIISHIEFLGGIVDWIKYHHKWYNGMGYPATNGNGHDVPIEAAIIAVADSFDAMTDDRELAVDWKCDSCGYQPEDGERPEACPKCGAEKRRLYREPKTLDQAIDELRRGAGSQFHPRVVKAFLSMVERDGVHSNA